MATAMATLAVVVAIVVDNNVGGNSKNMSFLFLKILKVLPQKKY